MLTLHNVIIFIKSILNEDKSHYHYNIFLEKCLINWKIMPNFFFDSITISRFGDTKIAKEECMVQQKLWKLGLLLLIMLSTPSIWLDI